MAYNVLLVHWHDLGRHLGTYGQPGVTSPTIDALAAGGIRFDSAFATAPLCSPSRSSLFTGLYPHANGMHGLAHAGWGYRDGVRTLPSLLSEHGWHTALAGMQHESDDPHTLGFDEVFAQDVGSKCDPVTDAASDWLRRRDPAGAPFFLTVGFEETHRPYPTDEYEPDDPADVTVPPYLPDNPWTRDDLAAFQGSIRKADAATSRLLRTLEDTGLADDTWVVFTTDHGIAFPRAKSTLYDPGLGVALVMRPPRGWSNAPLGPTDRLVSHVDFVPTVLDALGLPVPPAVQGKSYAAWLTGSGHCDERIEICAEKTYHDVYDPIRAIRTNEYKLVRNDEERPLLSLPVDIMSGPTRFGYGSDWLRPRPAVELYDLDADPCELQNVADDPAFAAVRAELERRLDDWQELTGDPLRFGPIPQVPWPRKSRFGALEG